MFDADCQRQLRVLSLENSRLRAQVRNTPLDGGTPAMSAAERGHQLRQIVDQIVSDLDAMGCYYIGNYRVQMAAAICDVLYGNLPVDLPSWGLR